MIRDETWQYIEGEDGLRVLFSVFENEYCEDLETKLNLDQFSHFPFNVVAAAPAGQYTYLFSDSNLLTIHRYCRHVLLYPEYDSFLYESEFFPFLSFHLIPLENDMFLACLPHIYRGSQH